MATESLIKTAIFRADSSLDIGTGHIMRCLAFADELKKKSIESHFICRNLPGNIHQIILQRGHQVTLLPLHSAYRSVLSDNDYRGWLQVTQQEDAKEVLDSINNYRNAIVICDHYGLGREWESEIKLKTAFKLIVIDDLVREHNADLIIDQTLGRSDVEYKKIGNRCNILAGSDYAIIRSKFYQQREKSFKKSGINITSILITIGGFDKKNLLSTIVESLDSSQIRWINKITILLNKTSSNYSELSSTINKNKYPIELIPFIEDMPTFMLNYDIAIGAPGSTTWERASLGIPSVLIPIAENQIDTAKAIVKKNAALIISENEISSKLTTALGYIKDNFADMQRNNYLIADGLGIRRIFQEIWPAKSNDGQAVTLRKANANDKNIVYKWQCQPSTRRYARDSSIPTYDQHELWMTKKLSDPFSYFYIISLSNTPVGVIRIDRVDDFCYELSIFLDENHHKKNIAKQAIGIVTDMHAEVDIIAYVLPENIASHALFSSLKFKKLSENIYKLERTNYE